MITIIKDADHTERKEFTCFNCGCVFQADKWDYEIWNPNGTWAYRIACPICKDYRWRKYNKHLKKYNGVRDVLKSEEETSNS